MEEVIIYCRKSAKPKNSQERKEEQKILSLQAQERELRSFALKSGFKIIKIFKENESAYKKGRPQFNKMVNLIKEKKACSLLVLTLSRISRNSSDGGEIIYLLDEGRIKSIITPQKAYKNTGEDKFILSIEFAMAKKSSDDTSLFVLKNIQAKADNGEFPGKAPLGYLNIDKENRIAGKKFDSKKQIMLEELGRPLKRIEIDPIDGVLVKQIFEEAAKGVYSLEELCALAYKIGLRANRSGKKMVKASLHRTLTNPFYYGTFLWEGNLYTKDIKHVALIPKELFNKVQAALDRKSFKKKEKVAYKFSGLMKCGECNSSISSQFQKGKRYYHCTAYEAKKQNTSCSQKKYYEESIMEKKIIELLKTLEIPSEFIEWGKSVLRENFEEENKAYENQRIANQKNLNRAKVKLHNLFQLKISPQNKNNSLLTDEEYLYEKRTLQKEINELGEKLSNYSQTEAAWLDRCEDFFDYTSKLQQNYLKSNVKDKQEILSSIGKIILNNGELSFQLKKPYLYAAEVVKICNSIPEISEPSKMTTQSKKTTELVISEPILSKWRDGRDSNSRPPA